MAEVSCAPISALFPVEVRSIVNTTGCLEENAQSLAQIEANYVAFRAEATIRKQLNDAEQRAIVEQQIVCEPLNDADSSDQAKKLKRELTNEQRLGVYCYLLQHSSEGKLNYGSAKAAAEMFSISRATVCRIWSQGKEKLDHPDVFSKKKGRVGRKKMDLKLSRIREIPLGDRTNLRTLAHALKISKTTLWSRIKEGLIGSNLGVYEYCDQAKKLKRELTNEQRLGVHCYLLQHSSEGKLNYGSAKAAAEKFSISRATVCRIWSQGKESLEHPDVFSKKKGRVGRKKVDIELSRIREMPLEDRTNLRTLAHALQISKTTLRSRIKEGLMGSDFGVYKCCGQNKIDS